MLVGAFGPDRAAWWTRERAFVIFAVLLLGFHTLVTTFTAGSGFLNSSPAMVPGCLLIYLLLPAPRPALEPLYRDEHSDGRFRFVGAVPHASPDLGRYSPLKLFGIR